MTVKARAPLRLGLAGGGTDVSPYCDIYGGNVLNATIDRYAYAVIKILDKPSLRFVAIDQQVEEVCNIDEPLQLFGRLSLHKAVYNHMIRNYNNEQIIQLEIITFCDAPVGSGLGTSSTLVVTMIRAYVELLNLKLDEYTIARAAYQIERIDCGLKGGRQDQYSASFGGFNFMEFSANEHAIITPLRIKDWVIFELEASLVLYFTGVSRESANIIADQSINVQSGFEQALDGMHGIKDEAITMKEYLLRGDFLGLADSIRLGWKNKKQTSNIISNPHIEEIYDIAIHAGAMAGKVSGAGGGGFMLFLVPTERRMNVIRALEGFGGQICNCHFSKYGAQAWRVR